MKHLDNLTIHRFRGLRDFLANAPSGVDEKQMKELQVRSTYRPKSYKTQYLWS